MYEIIDRPVFHHRDDDQVDKFLNECKDYELITVVQFDKSFSSGIHTHKEPYFRYIFRVNKHTG